MATTRRTLDQATALLGRHDPFLRDLIACHGTPPARPAVPSSMRFAALARSIVYQQLAGNAAGAIHARFVTALGGVITADAVLATSPDTLTACGLSGAKAAAVRDLAEKVSSGQVSFTRIGRLSDEAVIEHLVQVRGVGRWTAEMFLLGTLGRQDIWPVGDYGVRAGFALGWQLPAIPSSAELEALGEPYRPYRSLVAWYCWRAADTRMKPVRPVHGNSSAVGLGSGTSVGQ